MSERINEIYGMAEEKNDNLVIQRLEEIEYEEYKLPRRESMRFKESQILLPALPRPFSHVATPPFKNDVGFPLIWPQTPETPVSRKIQIVYLIHTN